MKGGGLCRKSGLSRHGWEELCQLLRPDTFLTPFRLQAALARTGSLRSDVAGKTAARGGQAVAEENLKKFNRKVPKTPVMPIAAAFDDGIEKFKKVIRKAVETKQ